MSLWRNPVGKWHSAGLPMMMETTEHADNTEGRRAENQTSRPDTSVPAHSPKEPNTPSNLSVRASQSLAPSAEPAERGRQSSYTPAEEAEVYEELEKLKASDPQEPKFRLPDDKTYEELIREDIKFRLREKKSMPEITPEKSIWLSHLRYLKSMTPEEIAHHNGAVTEDLNAQSESYVKDYSLQNNPQRPYYQIPFADGLKRAVDPAMNSRYPIFVSETPEVFRKIGFTALPMMMNVRHLRLNYYTEQEFKNTFGNLRGDEHAHGLHTYLNGLPNALKYPLAVVANLTPNAKPGSVVAITNMDVAGKKVVVPVLIEATSKADNQDIDAHLVLTVYDSNDWREKFLSPALDAEKNGVGVFYFDPKKAGRYSAYSQSTGTIPSGYVHNIDDQGSPVKGNFKKQTETLQFKRWFRDSKVVDADGKPLVVYHGTRGKFFVFDSSKSGSNLDFGTMGKGFYFTTDRENAENIAKNNTTKNGEPEVMSCFLNIRNPKRISWNEISGNDKEEAARLTAKWKAKGYDGFVAEAPNGATWWVAFSPEQIKSATDNIGTFDQDNPDIRYSLQNIWTGSAADYDQPSLHYIDTGEGAQVYGWGLYGSSSRGVGEWYAEKDVQHKRHPDVIWDGKPSDKFFRELRRDGLPDTDKNRYWRLSDLNQILLDKKGDVDRVINICRKNIDQAEKFNQKDVAEENRERIKLLEEYRDRISFHEGNRPSLTINGEKFVPGGDINGKANWERKMIGFLFSTNGDVYGALQNVKKAISHIESQIQEQGKEFETDFDRESLADLNKVKDFLSDKNNKISYDDGTTGRRNLYKQTFWPGKQEKLLDWDKKVPKSLMKQIREALRKSDLSFWADSSVFIDESGEQIYDQLVELLGSPKAASEFLYRAGIDGITYIGDDSGVRNYVAFSDKDIRVDDHIKYSLRKHRQVNPIVVNGQVRAEYADLLDNKEFTPETIAEWDKRAIAWIDRQGGIEAAAEMIANDTEHSDRHVATLVRRHVLNSEFASSLPDDIRMAVELKNIDEGTSWGREGVARRLAALTLKNIDTVKALFRKLHEGLNDREMRDLRKDTLDKTGIDISKF